MYLRMYRTLVLYLPYSLLKRSGWTIWHHKSSLPLPTAPSLQEVTIIAYSRLLNKRPAHYLLPACDCLLHSMISRL